MKKIKIFSAQFKIISEQPNQNQPNTASVALPESAKNNPSPKKKLSKQNQEFINNISASGFEQFNL